MILLTASRLDLLGQVLFRIDVSGATRSTKDAAKAARILWKLGVATPLALIEHARDWGSVEIEDPPHRDGHSVGIGRGESGSEGLR